MTPPRKHNVRQAAAIVGHSPSWMYQQGAAGNIPRTKIGHKVWWTDEQLAQIIRDGAQPAQPRESEYLKTDQREHKQRGQARQARAERQPKPKAIKPAPASPANIPVADFSVSRLYRQEGAA